MNTVTLKDIANLAHCSVNTVSLALKNSPRISEATRQRIQQIAQEQNYISNNMARALVLGQTHTIGLVLRNISSLLLTTEARYIERYLEKKGYTLYVIASHDDPDMEKKAIDLMISNRVDGMIVNTALEDNIPRLEALRAQGMPIVMISGFEYSPALDSIFPDLVQGAYVATRQLLAVGRTNIRYVLNGGIMEPLKLHGVRRALKEFGIPFHSDQLFIFSPPLAPETETENRLPDLLDTIRQGNAGLFVGSDETAIPLIKTLYQNGVQVPRDVVVTSIDNIRFAESSLVSLTTVGYDLEFISHRAVDMLLDIIRSGDDEENRRPFQNIRVEPKLYIRESCGNTVT